MGMMHLKISNMYHLLPKVWPEYNIKVSLAAQVMNNTVAAAINTLVTVGKNNSTVSLNDT